MLTPVFVKVYMITGIMIARGLEVHQSETDSIEHKMGGIVSTTLRPILPISATAGYTQTRGSSTLVECYQRKGPVVFAFKVHKLTLGYFHKDMSIDVYPEGGKFGGPGESSNQSNAISIDLYTEGVNFGEPGASSNQSNAMTKGQIEVTEKGIQDIQDVEVTEKDNLDIQEVEAETDLEHIDATPLSMEDLCEIQK